MMILGTKVCVTRGPIQTNKWPIFEFGHSLIRILQVIKLTFVLPHPQTLTLAPCGIHSPLWFLGIAIDAIRLALKLNDELSLRTQISLAWVLLLYCGWLTQVPTDFFCWVDSFCLISWAPPTAVTPLLLQWAAEMTRLALTMEPPQKWEPLLWRETMYGSDPADGIEPPII